MTILLITAVAFGLLAAGLVCAHRESAHDTHRRTIRRINDILPQTQCRKCGYAGCSPYAEAIVRAGESIDLCPPGGDVTRRTLAQMLGRDAGGITDGRHDEVRRVARIVEADCIGCTKCIQACPVDAIVGANGMMHTVVERWCTGCDLCAPVCPTDCIDMSETAEKRLRWRWQVPSAA